MKFEQLELPFDPPLPPKVEDMYFVYYFNGKPIPYGYSKERFQAIWSGKPLNTPFEAWWNNLTE